MTGINVDQDRYKMLKLYCNISKIFNGFIKTQNRIAKENNVSMVSFIYDYSRNEICLYDGNEMIHYNDISLKNQMIIDLFEKTTTKKTRKKLQNDQSKMYKRYERAKKQQSYEYMEKI